MECTLNGSGAALEWGHRRGMGARNLHRPRIDTHPKETDRGKQGKSCVRTRQDSMARRYRGSAVVEKICGSDSKCVHPKNEHTLFISLFAS